MREPGRFPPLNALRVFEAAARHLSFAKAADELMVTPSAISLQIKALEERLGVQLFQRSNRAIALTEAGLSLLPDLGAAFDRIDAAVRRLDRHSAIETLRVTASPSVAAKWLIPRIERFNTLYPEVSVRVEATPTVTDFSNDDVALRYGSGNYPGLYSRKLIDVEVFPVCSPKLLSGSNPPRHPADLADYVLLHEVGVYNGVTLPSWAAWLRAAGLNNLDARPGAQFSSSYLAMEAAAAGLGIALGIGALVSADLASGRLIRPFAFSLFTNFGFYFVCPERAIERPKVRAFHDWLFTEATNTTRPIGTTVTWPQRPVLEAQRAGVAP